MTTLARSVPAALALAAASFLMASAEAAPGQGGGHGGNFAGHRGGGSSYGGNHFTGYRGGYYRGGYWGHRGGYWGPGPFWGGLGLGLGVGAVVYSSGYYGDHYRGYYGPYYNDGYDGFAAAPEVIVAPSPEARVYRSGQPVPQAARQPDPIFYPKNNQNAATVENDRRDCNRWATTQQGAMADASIFQRATYACMEGRGYTVK